VDEESLSALDALDQMLPWHETAQSVASYGLMGLGAYRMYHGFAGSMSKEEILDDKEQKINFLEMLYGGAMLAGGSALNSNPYVKSYGRKALVGVAITETLYLMGAFEPDGIFGRIAKGE
jgi:hypothetical protein